MARRLTQTSFLLGIALVFGLSAKGQQSTALPTTINEVEGPFTGTWVLSGTNTYNATWNNGAVAILTVTSFTSDSVVIERTDPATSISPGLPLNIRVKFRPIRTAS